MDMEDARDKLIAELTKRPALSHLRVRKYGSSLILQSGQGQDEQKHARFTHVTSVGWVLGFPHHTGRWEKTPFGGSLVELLDQLTTDFSFLLERH